MRIMLCDMPISQENKFGKMKRFGSSSPPINILFLGTILERAGHEVRLTLEMRTMQEVAQEISSFDPHIVGVTFMTIGSVYLPDFAAMVKRTAPNVILITGGYHSSLFPEQVLTVDGVTAVFVGEGERNVLDFVSMCESGTPTPEGLAEIPGICFKDASGQTVQTGSAEVVLDLDDLPFPNFELIPGYFKDFFGSINRHYLGNPQALFLTSRGCPFSCRFCGRQILGQRVRSNSSEYLLELIAHCKASYGIKSIIYADEFFTLDRKKTLTFCDELERRDLSKIHWSCSGRVDNIDYEFASVLHQSGCRQIAYGSESGSQVILEMLGKKVTVEQNAKAVLDAAHAGLQTYGSFIIGSPGETVDTLEDTRRFILDNPFSFIGLLFFTPYPGSYFYEDQRYLQFGTIVDHDISHYNCFDGLPFVPHGMTAQYLRDFRGKLYRDFFLRSSRIVKEFEHILNPNSWRALFRLCGFNG